MPLSNAEKCRRYRDRDRVAYNAQERARRDPDLEATRTYARRHGLTLEDAAARRAQLKRRHRRDVAQLSAERWEV